MAKLSPRDGPNIFPPSTTTERRPFPPTFQFPFLPFFSYKARGSNIGNSNLYVDGPLNPVPGVADLDECAEPTLHDCGENARCVNTFGGFACVCRPGYGDRFAADPERAGRYCMGCSRDHCQGRGVCSVTDGGDKVCK